MRSKQLSNASVCYVQVFVEFSGHGNSIHNIIPLLKKDNVHVKQYWNQNPHVFSLKLLKYKWKCLASSKNSL